MQKLRPGEIKILKALWEEVERRSKGRYDTTYKDANGLSNGELYQRTGLATNILSEYLKSLQKMHLISRNIDNRKYRLEEKISFETLFFCDVIDFLQERLTKLIDHGDRSKAGITYLNYWSITTDNSEFKDILEKTFIDHENIPYLSKISGITEDAWNSFILSDYTRERDDYEEMKRKRNEFNVITKYKSLLTKYAKILDANMTKESRRQFYESIVQLSKSRMIQAFPGVPLPERMVYMEAAKEFKKLTKQEEYILQPQNYESLKHTIEAMKKSGIYRKRLEKKERDELKAIKAYLRDPQNKKTYEKYLERVRKAPKALIFYSSSAFGGYVEELKEWWRQISPSSDGQK